MYTTKERSRKYKTNSDLVESDLISRRECITPCSTVAEETVEHYTFRRREYDISQSAFAPSKKKITLRDRMLDPKENQKKNRKNAVEPAVSGLLAFCLENQEYYLRKEMEFESQLFGEAAEWIMETYEVAPKPMQAIREALTVLRSKSLVKT